MVRDGCQDGSSPCWLSSRHSGEEPMRSQGQSWGSGSVTVSLLSINVAKASPCHYGAGVISKVKQSQVDRL